MPRVVIASAHRAALLKAAVAGLEGALPNSVPARGTGQRKPAEVLVSSIGTQEAARAFADLKGGAGGELSVTKNGNYSFCSAESSALMAVNFLAPFGARSASLLGLPAGGRLSFERGLRVSGVQAPTPPTLDVAYETGAGAVFVEAKTAEPWRGAPKREISAQYDAPAKALSPGVVSLIERLRSDKPLYEALDAPQLIKHLLGIHSALKSGTIPETAKLVLLTWRPVDDGPFGPLFDQLQAEANDFACSVADQPTVVEPITTRELLESWSASEHDWLREHAACLRARYEPALS